MTNLNFKKEVRKIIEVSGLTYTKDKDDYYQIKTEFGEMQLRPEGTPKIKVYSIYIRYLEIETEAQTKALNDFYSKKGIHKRNYHESNPYMALTSLRELLKKLKRLEKKPKAKKTMKKDETKKTPPKKATAKREVFSKKKALQSTDVKTFLKGVIYLLKDNVLKGAKTPKEKSKLSNQLRGIADGWDKEKDKTKIKKVSSMLKKVESQLLAEKYTKAQEATFLKLAELYPRFEERKSKTKDSKEAVKSNFSKMFK